MLQLLRRADHIQASYAADYRIGQKPLQRSRIPLIGVNQQLTISLKVGAESADSFAEKISVRHVIANGSQAGPHDDVVGIASGRLC